MDQTLLSELEETGRVWFRKAIAEQDLRVFDKAVENQTGAGRRLDVSTLPPEAVSPASPLLSAIHRLDPKAIPVRAVAFNKSESANWGVPWHQDRVIAVHAPAQIPGYENWTQKAGIWHCEPPESLLDQMLFVRVHLDDTQEANGAMQIALGSHKRGLIPTSKAEDEAANFPHELCRARRGDVLVLKMLTLHMSKPAQVPTARRALRLDFASCPLPQPLSWSASAP